MEQVAFVSMKGGLLETLLVTARSKHTPLHKDLSIRLFLVSHSLFILSDLVKIKFLFTTAI